MKFGFFVMNQWLPEEDMGVKIGEAVEQVRVAKEAGFDIISTGQHYLSNPYQMPTILPFLARLAPEAQGMHLAATVLLLPLLPPVEIAESVATLDAMCGGKFITGVGLGYREEESISFGTHPKERVPRLLESLELMKQLWTEPEVDFRGKFYTVPSVKPVMRPVQRPYPPIWMAANNDKAVRRAALHGYPWLVNPHATVPTLERQVRMYRETLLEATGKENSDLPLVREMYLHTDGASALARAQPYLEPKYQAYAAWGQDKALPGQESFSVPFEELAKDRFLIGTPEEAVEEIRRYREQLGVTHMIFRMQWPGMPHSEVMRQMELFGKHVAPYFK